jgi:hypothetical protein
VEWGNKRIKSQPKRDDVRRTEETSVEEKLLSANKVCAVGLLNLEDGAYRLCLNFDK